MLSWLGPLLQAEHHHRHHDGREQAQGDHAQLKREVGTHATAPSPGTPCASTSTNSLRSASKSKTISRSRAVATGSVVSCAISRKRSTSRQRSFHSVSVMVPPCADPQQAPVFAPQTVKLLRRDGYSSGKPPQRPVRTTDRRLTTAASPQRYWSSELPVNIASHVLPNSRKMLGAGKQQPPKPLKLLVREAGLESAKP